jgi:hypothetical protein
MIAAVLSLHCLESAATELSDGFVIDQSNLDAIQEDTFEGHKIKDLLTDRMAAWIKNYGLKMPLRHSAPIELDPRYIKATEENNGKAHYNSATKTVDGYVSGIPFPNIDTNDPDAAYKLIWNHRLANPVTPDVWIADAPITITTQNGGISKQLRGSNYRYRMRGRYTGSQTNLSDAEHIRLVLALSQPYDVAGLGIFQIQYANGQPDDVYVYVKSLRRVRRVSGSGAWMDPQPQMDLLNDDNQGIDAWPGWYRDFKLKGERWLLAVVHAPDPNEPHRFEDRVEMKPPYWNPIGVTWEPRQVYVIEATPPPEHPYGKKILYMLKEMPTFVLSEIYDKKGQFWRIWRQSYAQIKSVDGFPGIGFIHSQAIDFQFERATYIDAQHYVINDPKITANQFNPNILSKFAAGQDGIK